MPELLKRIALVLAFSVTAFAQQPPALKIGVSTPFKFVAYGDMRFADPGDHNAGDEARREALIDKIADERPAFVVISGDLVVSGDEKNWKFWDRATQVWREQKIPVVPTLGNHDVRGSLDTYFQR